MDSAIQFHWLIIPWELSNEEVITDMTLGAEHSKIGGITVDISYHFEDNNKVLHLDRCHNKQGELSFCNMYWLVQGRYCLGVVS